MGLQRSFHPSDTRSHGPLMQDGGCPVIQYSVPEHKVWCIFYGRLLVSHTALSTHDIDIALPITSSRAVTTTAYYVAARLKETVL